MHAVHVIERKRDGHELTHAEIAAFVEAAARGSWADEQLAAMLMAIFLRGMNARETADLTRMMAQSGKSYRWTDIPGPKIDKHSTGGIGDKTSLVLVPLVAACGGIVPMMSGRGLGYTGGTLDKLEAIPGFRVELSEHELREALRTIGAGMIGQSASMVPADRKLYALRDVTATVESIPLITASILSKKLAAGIEGLVMDVKWGRGAFMKTVEQAEALATSLITIGRGCGLHVEALLTGMQVPLGRMIGNSLEVHEAIATLRCEGPKDVEDLSVALAARMLLLGKLASTPEEAETKIRHALSSGAGLEKWRQIIAFQGGDPHVIDEPTRLPMAPHTHAITCTQSGFVADIDAHKMGVGTMLLGGGRQRPGEQIDHSVGVRIEHPVGDSVRASETIFVVHYREETRLRAALPYFADALQIEPFRPTSAPLIRGIVS